MDIKPRKPRPMQPSVPQPMPPVAPPQLPPIEPLPEKPSSRKKWSVKKIVLFSGLGLLVVLMGLFTASFLWYQSQLTPVGKDANEHIKVTIKEGTTPGQIATLLEESKVIKNDFAFGLYTRLSGTQNQLQAGTYRLSPADSTPEIVEHLVNGNVDTFSITFLPGATLRQNREVLVKAGYSEQEIDEAFAANYSSPLFADRTAGADLEGYIYGETYSFGSDATVKDILQYTFDTFEGVIEKNDLVAKFKAQGLTLYQGIILASIVQRESGGNDEAEIASVFYNRRAAGMELGSDVTYQYIADKLGVARDPNLDSPYNTRRYAGLPPGPIATPGLKALLGVANPANTNYLFFLSGDDNVTYYSVDFAGHERNIADHCKQKCQIL